MAVPPATASTGNGSVLPAGSTIPSQSSNNSNSISSNGPPSTPFPSLNDESWSSFLFLIFLDHAQVNNPGLPLPAAVVPPPGSNIAAPGTPNPAPATTNAAPVTLPIAAPIVQQQATLPVPPPSAASIEINEQKLNQLTDWISLGLRAKFRSLSRADLKEWVIEGGLAQLSSGHKGGETWMKEFKSQLEAGVTVSEGVWAKGLRCWLGALRNEGIEEKSGKGKNGAAGQGDAASGASAAAPAGAAGKKGAAPAPQTGKAATKGDANATAAPTSAGKESTSARTKQKLRDRNGMPGQKDRVHAIGDEPADGPDVYYFLRDFDTAEFVACLTEECETPLDLILRVVDNTEAAVKKGERERVPEHSVNQGWLNVRNRALRSSGTTEYWRRTCFSGLLYTETKDIKEMYEIVATRIYTILSRKRQYEFFYRGDRVVSIPTIDPETVDMVYYKYLERMSDCRGVGSCEMVVGLLLEGIGRAVGGESGGVVPGEGEMITGMLKQYLDEEISRVSLDSNLKRLEGGSGEGATTTKDDSLAIIHSSDTNTLHSYYMKALNSLDLNPLQMIRKLEAAYASKHFLNILELDQTLGESLKLQTEFLRNSTVKGISPVRLGKFLVQLDMEAFCKPLLDPSFGNSSSKVFSLDEWTFNGSINASALLQSIENEKVTRPETHHLYSALPGKILLLLKSPGPLGCLEYKTEQDVHFRTKAGFSKFFDSFDPAFNSLGVDKAHPITDAVQKYAYDMKDTTIAIHKEVSYLYPANNIIVAVTTQTSPSLGKDVQTKINCADTFITYSGPSQSKTGQAFFTTTFHDGSVFSASKQNGLLNVQFSDATSNHYTFGRDGSISSQSFVESPHMDPKSRELKRIMLPSGIIIKIFEGFQSVLHPDGSKSERYTGKEWVTTPKLGEKGHSLEKTVEGEQKINRDDFVTITEGRDGASMIEYPCSTTVNTSTNGEVSVSNPGSVKIVFEVSGTQIVKISPSFVVERTFVDGQTTKVKIVRDNLSIDFSPEGEVNVHVHLNGYISAAVSEQMHNDLNINWMEGTLKIIDILNYEFSVNGDGSTAVVPPSEPIAHPTVLFGGKHLKNALKGENFNRLLGNAPVLYAISPDQQESYQIQRSTDLVRFFQSHKDEADRIVEEVGQDENSLTFTTAKEYRIPGVEQTLVHYTMHSRYNPVSEENRAAITAEYNTLKSKVITRNSIGPKSDLGETFESHEPSSGPGNTFVFGMNKEDTQLTILMNHLQKEDLEITSGTHVTMDMQKLLSNAKGFTKKASTTEKETKKGARKYKGSTVYKVPKYFDSPEGQSFLETLKVEGPQAFLAEDSSVSAIEGSASQTTAHSATLEEGIPASAEEKTQESTRHTEVVEKLEESMPQVKEAPSLPEISHEKGGGVHAIHTKSVKEKKERKLVLPNSIMGAKPGMIPNTSHIKRELEARRQLKTVSVASQKVKNSSYGISGFVIFPASCDFGIVPMKSNHTLTLEMTNIGLDPARFALKQEKVSQVTIKYKHGFVAPGMSVKFEITLKAGEEAKVLQEELKVVSETEILHIPVKASIQ